MANPFKDADKRKKVAPGVSVSELIETVKPEPVIDPEPESAPVSANKNPLAGMIENKKAGQTKAFYLSQESIDKLNKLAKMNKCSTSKALDMLIKNSL